MASSKAAAATITIHRGELAQIRSQIETQSDSKEPIKGQLYGLWTHSFQPVIQLVVVLKPSSKASGRNQPDEGSQCKDFISDTYGLCLLGEWLGVKEGSAKQELPKVRGQKRHVNIVFSLEDRETCITKSVVNRGAGHNDEKGKLEILPGQSSFRLCENLIEKLHLKSAIDVSEEDRAAERGQVREAEVKEDQWYSTESGMEILKSLFQILPNHFEVLETSRCTETHNIGFSLKYKGRGGSRSRRDVNLRLEFPANFPESDITVFCGDQGKPVSINREFHKEPETFSQVICTSVVEHLQQRQQEPRLRQTAIGREGSRINAAKSKGAATQDVNTPRVSPEDVREGGKPRDKETVNEETQKKENDMGEIETQLEKAPYTERQTPKPNSGVTPMEVEARSRQTAIGQEVSRVNVAEDKDGAAQDVNTPLVTPEGVREMGKSRDKETINEETEKKENDMGGKEAQLEQASYTERQTPKQDSGVMPMEGVQPTAESATYKTVGGNSPDASPNGRSTSTQGAPEKMDTSP